MLHSSGMICITQGEDTVQSNENGVLLQLLYTEYW